MSGQILGTGQDRYWVMQRLGQGQGKELDNFVDLVLIECALIGLHPSYSRIMYKDTKMAIEVWRI